MTKTQKGEILVNGYAYPSIKKQVLEQAAPNLTFLSSFHYGIGEDGHLMDLNDETLLAELQSYPVAPLMVVTAISDMGGFQKDVMADLLQSKEMQANLLMDIANTIQSKGFAGVDFDFEYIYPQYKDDYANLIACAKKMFNPKGWVVTATVAPKTSTEQQGLLYEGHDYRAIGKASNFVMVMTYEWGYTYGPPMAIAPVNKVREVLDYGVTQIPSTKLLMGVPNYGYDWTLPYVKGESKARSISNEQAVALAQKYGVAIEYDAVAQAPHFSYTAEDGKQHEVWFEDERSYMAKMQLVKEYDLAGIGIWNLMSNSPALWKEINEEFSVIQVR